MKTNSKSLCKHNTLPAQPNSGPVATTGIKDTKS